MTITNEANQVRLKSRPGIILEFDPPRWDDMEVADTVGRVYMQNGLKVYKVPGDIPKDADYNTIEPGEINPDGTVQQWYYTRTSEPDAETMQNRNRKLAEQIEAERIAEENYYNNPPVVSARKPRRFDSQLRRLEKSLTFSFKVTGLLTLVLLIIWGVSAAIGQLTTPSTQQVTVRVAVLPKVSFQYVLPAIQLEKQLTTSSMALSLEAEGEATGTVQVPDATAKGQVRFLNSGPNLLTLPVGTVIASANGINYKLVQAVTIPGSNIPAGKAGVLDTTVQADQAGPVGNLPGGIGTFAFRGTVTVGGLGPVSGGTNQTVKTVTAGDTDRMRSKLLEQAKKTATTSFDQRLTSEQKRWGAVELVQAEYTTPEPDSEQASGKFKGTIKYQISAPCYRPNELLKLVVTPPSAVSLPLAYGAARGGDLNKDLQGNFSLSYTRSLQIVGQPQTWKGNRTEYEKLLTQLKNTPGLNFVGITGDLPQNWQGQMQVIFQLN